MKITDALLKQIYAHGRETYPRECFGFLIGLFVEDGIVRQVIAGTNLNTERNDRFEMDPLEFVKVDRAADEAGYEIIGFYHSHPDWPAIPSQTDILSEVEGSYYMIVSIHEGRPLNTAVWKIAPSSATPSTPSVNGSNGPRRFIQLPLEIVDEREWHDSQ